MRSLAWPTLVVLLAASPAARAWGPFTHAMVNQRALARLAAEPATAFLADPELAELFVRSGPSADLTFDPFRAGKGHEDVNDLLHDPAFLEDLHRRAVAGGDPTHRAFALGLVGHLAADLVGNQRHGLVHRNVFDFPADRDLLGRAADERESAAQKLLQPTASVNKILVDALLRPERVAGRADHPNIPVVFLSRALRAYEGEGALENDGRLDRARIVAQATRFAGLFPIAYQALGAVARKIERAADLREGAARALGVGPGGEVPGIAESADAVVLAVTAVAAGGAMPRGASFGCRGAREREAAHQDLCDRVRALHVRLRDEDRARRPASPLPRVVPAGTPDPDVGSLRRQVFMKFFVATTRVEVERDGGRLPLTLAGPSWADVRREVRGVLPWLVGAAAAANPGAPRSPFGAYDELAGGR